MGARQIMAWGMVAAVLCGCGTRPAYVAPRPSMQPPARHEARWTGEPIRVDGRMDENVWAQRTPIRLAGVGRPAQLATELRIAWGRDALYLFFKCEDPDIWSNRTAHDGKLWEEEVVEAFIDADNDRKQYIELEVNPRNATFDAWIESFPPTAQNIPRFARWEAAGMRTAVHVDGTLVVRTDSDRAWSCEMAIPWQAFTETGGHAPKAGSAWGMNFFRCDISHGKSEYQAWNITRGSFHQPDRFGEVVFAK